MASPLTPEQLHALFDILTHHETYAEIESFKKPEAVATFGYPFAPLTPDAGAGNTPVLQTLTARFLLDLPSFRDLPQEWWSNRIAGIIARLAEHELSESYDKGAMGTRKTLSTGSSAVLEMLGRGHFGGVKPLPNRANRYKTYDRSRAESLEEAWTDILDGLIYGTTMNEAWDHMGTSADLEAFSPGAEAAVDYIIIHMATFLHQMFVLSPEGQYVLKLMDNVHGLIPYKMIKQTLRVGNAATMMNAMTRLLLAKLSVAGLTNWVRLTQKEDDGQNLLQRIVSLVMSWDASEFKKTATALEKEKPKNRPSDAVLQAIRQHVGASRQQHDAIRAHSMRNGQSIVAAILNATDPSLAASLTEEQHTQCMQYYSALLSVRDRDAITSSFCKQTPDLLTSLVREVMTTFEPLIRVVHERVDLREHFDSIQEVMDDFLKTSKPKDGQHPSVEDYVQLLQRNKGNLYKWLHAICSKCPEVGDDFRAWARVSLDKFKQEVGPDNQSPMDHKLNSLYESLAPASQATVLKAIDAHSAYLNNITALSRSRLQSVALTTSGLNGVGYSGHRTMQGPGVYLARWTALMNRTLITPAGAGRSNVRFGMDVKNQVAQGKVGLTKSKKGEVPPPPRADEGPMAPDVRVVVKELGANFQHILRELGGPDKQSMF